MFPSIFEQFLKFKASKIVHRYFVTFLDLGAVRGRDLRDNMLLHLPALKTTTGQSTFQYSRARD